MSSQKHENNFKVFTSTCWAYVKLTDDDPGIDAVLVEIVVTSPESDIETAGVDSSTIYFGNLALCSSYWH